MTNPIPKYIDKQKRFNMRFEVLQESYATECDVEYGDMQEALSLLHSAQEEITKLKGEREFHRGRADTLEFRSLQAEQERETPKEALQAVIGEGRKDLKKAQDRADAVTADAKQLLRERNALLELLRYFVERTTIDHSYTHTPEYANARSIIAKLEGREPDVAAEI